MRLLVCGSRTWKDSSTVRCVLSSIDAEHVVLIHGDCRGADQIAAAEAQMLGWDVVAYPADWDSQGPAAGPMRNARMLREGRPDVVIAFRCEGKSTGTDDMVRRAERAGVPVRVVRAA